MTGPLGPFSSALEWNVVHVQIAQQEHSAPDAEDREDRKRLDVVRSYHGELLELASALAASSDLKPLFPLRLHDLHESNIMLDDDGNLLAIIDWEFTSTAPIWEVAQYPKFCCVGNIPPPTTHEPDGSVYEGYEADLYEHQMYRTYRRIYANELTRLQPDWNTFYSSFPETEFADELDRATAGDGADEFSACRLDEVWNVVESRQLPFHSQWSRLDDPEESNETSL